MLNVVGMGCVYCSPSKTEPNQLWYMNPPFNFYVEAPLFWWLDFPYEKFGFELGDFSDKEKLDMPVSTIVKGCAVLTYNEIIEVCEDYIQGAFKYEGKSYQWNAEREWNDFCETMLDIKGVRDLVQEVS